MLNKLTQVEAGERAYMDFRKLSRIELRQLPTYHELVILLDAYGVPSCDYGQYLGLWELASQRPWWRQFDLGDTRYVRMEDEAARKVEFQLGQIPTLLQTEAHARKTLAKQNASLVPDLVAFRMRQQKRLTTEPLLEFHALIHESVLRRGVDRAQRCCPACDQPGKVTHADPRPVAITLVPCAQRIRPAARRSVQT
nr:Scr1 family TA system antitoxin-like transcriptional regulator [Kibdelosporangium sp. MJ126-NF4]CEL18594.1 Putative DNA-binding protein [Kibdelosporangium sp. MJ126-NF4]CTQ98079.1 Putative DNA-binding protein [Kibdelosporangium sp. MJ126-NF4]